VQAAETADEDATAKVSRNAPGRLAAQVGVAAPALGSLAVAKVAGSSLDSMISVSPLEAPLASAHFLKWLWPAPALESAVSARVSIDQV